MKNHLEIEYKTLLTSEEYDKLLKQFETTDPIYQTNYYIDTPKNDVRKHRFSLRIRTFHHSAELTLKIPQEVGNCEYNQPLDSEEACELIRQFRLPAGDIYTILSKTNIPLHDLYVWGNLQTMRYEKMSKIGLMALDKNTYGNQTDYELEVEVSDAEKGKKDFECYLNENNLIFKYASSKVARTAVALLKKEEI